MKEARTAGRQPAMRLRCGLLLCSWFLCSCHLLFDYQAPEATADAAVVGDALFEGVSWDAADGGSEEHWRLVSGEGSRVLMHEITSWSEGFAVVWSGYSATEPQDALYVRLLSHSGEPRGPGVRLHGLDWSPSYLKVFVRGETLYIFYWKKGEQLSWSSVTLSEGTPKITQQEVTIGWYAQPWVFLLGGAFGVAYVSGSPTVVHLQPLDAACFPLGDSLAMPNEENRYQSYPSALATEQGVVLAWRQGVEVVSATATLDLAFLDGPWTLPKRAGESSARHTELAPLDDGRSLLGWHTSNQTLFLLPLGADAAPSWPEPLALEVGNVLESLDYALVGGPDFAVVAWESDRDTALTQVCASKRSLVGSETAPPPELIVCTDPQDAYLVPRLARRGSEDYGMIVKGTVQGVVGSFFRRLVLP